MVSIRGTTSGGSPAAQLRPDHPPVVHVAGQELTIFVQCGELFECMLEDIRNARKRVWLETYIFFNDSCGHAIADALKERARAGVDVRVLYDAVGSQAAGHEFFRTMAVAGVQTHAYHRLWEALSRFSLLTVMNRRDHRKLLIIDDKVAYFGGMNIIDTRHTDRAPLGRRITASAGWRDVHIRLAGDQQAEVAESFDRSWRRAHNLPVRRRPSAYRRAQMAISDEHIRFFDSGPGRKNSRAARVFTVLIRRSYQRVNLSMAYFIPMGRVLRAMMRARRRGVRIRIVVPAKSDVPLAQYASYHLFARMLPRHFRIYERERRMLHSKVMVVDGQWTVVGSCNMDPRSLWLNLEFMAVIRSNAFACEMEKIFAYELHHSRRLKADRFTNVPLLLRARFALAWSLRWWL